jgi:hypothetical protein
MKIFYTICFLSFWGLLNGQVKSVGYKLKLNSETGLYDAYLKIEKGSAIKSSDLIQYNAQMSIFVPQGSKLNIVSNILPYNINKEGNEVAGSWKISDRLPEVPLVNNQTIYSIVPNLSPKSYYKELLEGKEYKLFSFEILPKPLCRDVVRLYDNINDHKNTVYNYKGGNFRNGYTLGTTAQLYDNNTIVNNVHQMTEIVLGPIKEEYQEGEKLEVLIENRTPEYNYFLASKKGRKVINDLVIEKLMPELSGEYKVVGKNKSGCNTEKEFSLNVKPLAIPEVVKPIVDKVNIYPNPVKDNLNIYLSTKETSVVSADIYDQSGRIIKRNIINEKNHKGEVTKSINLDLSSGLYHVKMTINGVQTNHPFIVVE